MRFRIVMALAAVGLVLPACCLTDQIWDRTRRTVAVAPEASVDQELSLTTMLWLDNGEQWVVRVPHALDPDVEPGAPEFREVGMMDLPPSVVPTKTLKPGDRHTNLDPDRVFVMWDRRGSLSYGLGSVEWRHTNVPLGRDWWSGSTVLAVLLTPVTVFVDCITAPIEFGWMAVSAGGHGRNPIPWCEH